MAQTKTIVSVKTLYLSINIKTKIIITETIFITSTNSFNLKKHLTYFSYQRSCGFADSSYILHIP